MERRAGKELTRLPKQAQSRIIAAIDALADTPRPTRCLPVQNSPKGTYRIRAGNYRVIYVVLDKAQVIVIARITRRTESTYRGL